MMKNIKISVPFVIVLFLSFFSQAQTKYEREYRIEPEEVPQKALQFLHSAGIDFSEKWYFEENLEGNSIEAKFKYNRKRYSIEFDTPGNLLDIEIETPFKDLPEALQASIKNSLQNTYSKFTIRKMQVQYSGTIDSFAGFLAESNQGKQYTIHYEFIVKGRKNRQWNLYEITFSNTGELLSTDKIVLRNTDHLEF